jgi:hypothetical protein
MKHNHKTFIIEMIKHGDKTLAYQKAYPNCTDDESARKSAERLLRHHPDIAEEIEEATAQIRHQAYTDAYRLYTEQQKTKLLSIMDKREILARIAKCEIKVCRYIKDGDRYRMLFEDPHPREIMRAIEADGRIEDRCNRARNLADPKLSQFNVYIDGRPCDDPTAPVNPDLPPGIVMLPRTRKKLTQEQGNKTEQTTKKGSFPVFREGGTNEESDGRVDSRRLPAPEQTLTEEQGNKTEQTTSPLQGVPIAIGIGVQPAPDQTHLSLRLSHSAVKSLNTMQHSPLYPQYLALYQKRKLQAEDLLSASFYSQEQRAIASAPPPHILTEEEVRQLHADADNKKEQNKKQPQQPYNTNTFGKMYFPPDRR